MQSFYLQQDVNQRPQHLSAELYQGTIHASATIGAETITTKLKVKATGQSMMTAMMSISLNSTHLTITSNASTCAGGAGCFASGRASVAGFTDLDGPVFFGGLGSVSAYMRSKLQTTKGFRGCLGVRILDTYSFLLWNLSS